MAGVPKIRLPKLSGTLLWAPIVGLLTLGLVTTLIDLSGLSARETARATAEHQRLAIDAMTGAVAAAGGSSVAEAPNFDVAAADETAAIPPEGEQAPAVAEAPPEPEPEPLPEGTPPLRTEPVAYSLTAPTPTAESLVSAPAPEVSEQVDGMTLPKMSANNVAPSTLYARPFARSEDKALISFVVMDAGITLDSIGMLMALPPEVSIAYSPYASKTDNYSEHLRTTGHEVWTMLPTMNERYPNDDPGPLGIIGRMPPEEVVRRTQGVLAAISGSVGIVLPVDETIVLQKDGLTPVLAEIAKRGLLMLSTHPSRNIDQITTDAKLSALIRRADLILDPTPNESLIRSKLAGIADAAREKGEYVVVLTARPQSIALLSTWLKETTLEAPLTLAPLSAIYKAKGPAEAMPEAADDGHGAKKEKPKPKAKPKVKVLPQDKYKQPAEKPATGGH